MKVYVAGPMTGYPQFNKLAFEKAAKELRARGHDVVSPIEMDGADWQAIAGRSADGDPIEVERQMGLTWGDFLSRDVKVIADSGFDAIYVLPGWRKSQGARLETFVAHLKGIPIISMATGQPISALTRVETWSGDLLVEALFT